MHIAALLLTAVFAQATATTGPTESVTTGSAVVTGTVAANATYHFEYGTSASYGLRTPDATADAGGAARHTLTNLTPSTQYHYRVVSGGAQGADRTFTTGTQPRAPSVSSPARTCAPA
jgi:phosphodiesterase/alkaline phosphatase D-like protein